MGNEVKEALEAARSSESRVLAQRAQGPGVYSSQGINQAWLLIPAVLELRK